MTTTTVTTDRAADATAEALHFSACWEALQRLEPHWTTTDDRHGHTRRMIDNLSGRTR